MPLCLHSDSRSIVEIVVVVGGGAETVEREEGGVPTRATAGQDTAASTAVLTVGGAIPTVVMTGHTAGVVAGAATSTTVLTMKGGATTVKRRIAGSAIAGEDGGYKQEGEGGPCRSAPMPYCIASAAARKILARGVGVPMSLLLLLLYNNQLGM